MWVDRERDLLSIILEFQTCFSVGFNKMVEISNEDMYGGLEGNFRQREHYEQTWEMWEV